MSEFRSGASSGIGIVTCLFLIFLVLRLTDQIDWAWYWVAAPLWISWIIGAMIILVVAAWLWRADQLTTRRAAAQGDEGGGGYEPRRP